MRLSLCGKTQKANATNLINPHQCKATGGGRKRPKEAQAKEGCAMPGRGNRTRLRVPWEDIFIILFYFIRRT
jgi:hypothetical protein